MSRRLTSQEVRARMRSVGLIMLGEYPGQVKARVPVRCRTCKHEYETTMEQVSAGKGCTRCRLEKAHARQRVSEAEARRRMEDADMEPLVPYPGGAKQPWKARCKKCGHVSSPLPSALLSRGGCRPCGNKGTTLTRKISTQEAERRLRAAGLDPLVPYPGTVSAKWRARCAKCGTTVSPTLAALTAQGGCRACGNERAAANRRLTPKEAERRFRAAHLVPLEPYPGTVNAPWRARCKKCRTTVSPTVAALSSQGGCKACSLAAMRQRQLAKWEPEARKVMDKAGFEPLDPFPGIAKPWRSRCRHCGKTSKPRVSDLRRGNRCVHCAQRAPMTEREAHRLAKRSNRAIVGPYEGPRKPVLMRCLACGAEDECLPRMLKKASAGNCQRCKPTAYINPEQAVLMMRAVGLEPLVPYPGARKPWPAVCTTCGVEGHPQLGNIRQGQRGCRTCSNYGYDVRKPTTLYVLVHKGYEAVKVGITNTGSVRLRQLRRVGWVPGKLFEFEEGLTPLRIETLVLRRLRVELGLKPAVTHADMRGVGGATETFLRSEVSPATIYRMVRLLMAQQ